MIKKEYVNVIVDIVLVSDEDVISTSPIDDQGGITHEGLLN